MQAAATSAAPQSAATTASIDPADKRGRFKRVTPRRLAAALKAMRRLEQTANPHGYSYRESEALQIVQQIDEAAAAIRERFLVNEQVRQPQLHFED